VTRITARALEARLKEAGDPADAVFLAGYFKTGPGEYGEGDRFLGIRVPVLRRLVRAHPDLPLRTIRSLLRSRWHEIRLFALLALVRAYQTAARNKEEESCERIHELYLANLAYVNNWDLVDLSAPGILGEHLRRTARPGAGAPAPLPRLARSSLLWARRVSILAPLAFTRTGQYGPTMAIAERLLNDEHDLIHKAVGWMLREIGNRDRAEEERFLKTRYSTMPRTMLRYAIEKFPEARRRRYLEGTI